MHLEAHWKIVGVVMESRELKSEKNATWRGYVCKVATFGMAAEVTLNAELFRQVGAGQYTELVGRFEDQKGFLKLICERVKLLSEKAGAA